MECRLSTDRVLIKYLLNVSTEDIDQQVPLVQVIQIIILGRIDYHVFSTLMYSNTADRSKFPSV